MTFDARETGLFTAEPQSAFLFERGALVWRYATGDRPVVIDGQTFPAPGGVSRSQIQDSSQRAKNRLTITLPADLDVVDNWLPVPTHGRVLVTCYTKHKGDSEFVIEWTGRVVGPQFFDTKIELVCEPSRSITKSRGNKLRWQRGCPLVLYSQGLGMCNVDKALHEYSGTITAVSGLNLTADAYGDAPAGRLAGGFIWWTRPDGESDFRTIMGHAGDTITVDYATDTIAPGTVVKAYKGCKHDWTDCDTEFGNTDNYGGDLYIPVKSPHDGEPVQ